MYYLRNAIWNNGVGYLLGFALLFLPIGSHAARSESLSYWLETKAVKELGRLFTEHPRFGGQRLQLEVRDTNALGETIRLALFDDLGREPGLNLVRSPASANLQVAMHGSVDELDCQPLQLSGYLLRVSIIRERSAPDRVTLQLVDAEDPVVTVFSMRWSGRLSDREVRQADTAGSLPPENGSLQAPWNDRSVDAAARALSRDFVCDLRPWIRTRLSLQWPIDSDLPATFADTANASRHLLGTYRELSLTDAKAEYRVTFRLERFRHPVWQLWLVGTPLKEGLVPVQAVTYFRSDGKTGQGNMDVAQPALKKLPPDLKTLPGNALDFIDVEFIDATQTDLAGSKAELQVTLRIGNRADWPIEYAFSLSGGHFNHCLASPGHYRHDRYGRLAGSVPGQTSVVRRLIIEDAQHRPRTWFGVAKCAGFRDLDGFEKFASMGHKVTDFVRWDM